MVPTSGVVHERSDAVPEGDGAEYSPQVTFVRLPIVVKVNKTCKDAKIRLTPLAPKATIVFI